MAETLVRSFALFEVESNQWVRFTEDEKHKIVFPRAATYLIDAPRGYTGPGPDGALRVSPSTVLVGATSDQ